MKIALFVHCYFPGHFYGTESYTQSLACNLSALGHEVVVVTATFAGEPEQRQFIDEYVWEGSRVVRMDRNRLPNRTVRDTYHMPELRPVLERILRREQPDVVHVCHLVNHTGALLEVLAALAIPAVATFTDFYGICFNNKLQAHDGALCSGPDRQRTNCLCCYIKEAGEQHRALVPRLAAKSRLRPIAALAATHAPSLLRAEWQAELRAIVARPEILRELYGIYRASIAPTQFLHDAYRANGFAGRLDISRFGIDIDRAPKPVRDGSGVSFGFVGQLAAHKGVHLLVEAMARLPPGKAHLSIWGDETSDPAYSATLRAMAAGLPIAFRGTFPPAEMAERLGEVDVLVIPSIWYENSPLILLNALATHTPVIVSDVAGMTEFVSASENGMHFSRGDTGALADAMGRFCDDPGLARAMSAQTRYDRSTRDMVMDIVRIYEEVA